jgi:two-component system nitrogen regulation sensor histidine kinase NtrY
MIINNTYKTKVFYYLALMMLFFAFAQVFEKNIDRFNTNEHIHKSFQTDILTSQLSLKNQTDELLVKIDTSGISSIQTSCIEYTKGLRKKGFFFFVYKNNNLVFWSNNRIAEADILPNITKGSNFLQLSNGLFLVSSKNVGNYNITGLFLIKNSYSVENKIINSSFNNVFDVPENTKVNLTSSNSLFPVYDINGDFIFSLVFPENRSANPFLSSIIVFMYILSFVFFILFISNGIRLVSRVPIKLILLFVYAIVLFVFKYVSSAYAYPEIVYKSDLFQPAHFASSNLLASLGDLLLTSFIVFFLAYIIHREFSGNLSKLFKSKYSAVTIRFLGILILVFLFVNANNVFESIIYNSNISFEIHDLFNIKFYTLVGFVSIGLLFLSFVIVADFFIKAGGFSKKIIPSLIEFVVISCIVFWFAFSNSSGFNYIAFGVLVFTFCYLWYIRIFKQKPFKYAQYVLFAFVFSFYIIVVVFQITGQKLINEKKLLATNLVSEHDVIAEYLIFDVSEDVKSDTVLKRIFQNNDFTYSEIYAHLNKQYFKGYWEKYDYQVTLCLPSDSVLIQPDNYYRHCFQFFDELIKRKASIIPYTSFYFLDNANGRISYLGKFEFKSANGEKLFLYIQLDSKLMTDELGYPELLLDDKYWKSGRRYGYSYARYYKKRLIAQSGNFSYNLNADKYSSDSLEYELIAADNYDHLLFKPDKQNIVILSNPTPTFFHKLVTFSYVFIFYFILVSLFMVIPGFKKFKFNESFNFKNKIQYSLIGLLILSLIVVGGFSILFSIQQYKNKQKSIISEKMQSVYLELENILQNEETLSGQTVYGDKGRLDDILRNMSNIFYTDINLYNPEGKIIASSRPEVYDKGILGTRMNAYAYYQLSQNYKTDHLQNEVIGNLKFISGYTPFVNNNDKLLAYLNLPYFTRQSAFTEELSGLILTIINFYVFLLFISILLAVFISRKITSPLRMLQNKFSEIKLGKKTEKIYYNGHDEIADLINEYNRMVDELEKNLDLLAKSERESAWREMAKQIAHEIKNPLTPMKLSIQHLQVAWKDKPENFDEYIKKLSKTLIEQIDNLAAIATEFSNFAKMPKPVIEKIDLVLLVGNVVELYHDSDVDIKFDVQSPNKQFEILADKEQLSRVFINLITNAIQAIPLDRKGEIKISIYNKQRQNVIQISDNGSGIPDYMMDKLFQPNFTTKSGGMGLGLAIVKNIINQIGGTVNFETETGKGTTFYIIFL